MFFSHIPELMAVLVVGLLVFGPKRLPEIGSSVGQSIRELKRGLNEMHEPAQSLRAQLLPEEQVTIPEPRPMQTEGGHHVGA